MTRKFSYDDRAEDLRKPLQLAEVEALILNGGKTLERSAGRLTHFLHRVAATILDHAQRLTQLQFEIDELRSRRTEELHPLARAIDALDALDEDQKRQLLDQGYLREIARLEKAREDADMTRAAADNETNRVRHTLGLLLDDPDVPAETKGHVLRALARIGYQGRV